MIDGPSRPAPAPSPPAKPGWRVPIRLKLLLMLVALASVVSAVVASALIRFFNEDKATYIQDLNADIAGNTASSIGLLLELYEQRVGRIGETFNGSAEPGPALAELFETNADIVYLAVYDADRTNLLSLCRERSLEDAGVDVEAFHEERESLEVAPDYLQARGSVSRNSSAGTRLLTFSLLVPFQATRYGRTFAIRADFAAEPMLRAVRRAPGFTAYVVDRTGAVFVHPDAEAMAVRQVLIEQKVVSECVRGMGRAAAGTGEFEGPLGETLLASYAVVRNADLGVIVERPKKDAWLAAQELTRQSVRAAILVIVIAGLFSFFLARTLSRPLLELSSAAQRLEKGDFDVRVTIGSRDELGELAHSFNTAAMGLRQRDEELKGAYEQLLQSEKLASFGKFSAGIAHEIKNPLTGIIGFAQMLHRKLPEDDPKKRPLSLIEREAKRCKSILDNLLKFTRKESFQFAPVHVNENLRDTLDLCAPQLGVSRVDVITALDATDDLIHADGNQIGQVFMNLVLNAIDAMEVTPEDDRQIRVTSRNLDAGMLEVSVADSGPGIPEGVIRKVFDPFFTTKEQGKGTGLGLSVSYGIITNHGGKVTVRNRAEGGAEFVIRLPLAPAEVQRLDARHRAAAAAAASDPAHAVSA